MQAHFVTKFCRRKKQLRCVAKVTRFESLTPRHAQRRVRMNKATPGPSTNAAAGSVAGDDRRGEAAADGEKEPVQLAT
jgi:hypothetical protein